MSETIIALAKRLLHSNKIDPKTSSPVSIFAEKMLNLRIFCAVIPESVRMLVVGAEVVRKYFYIQCQPHIKCRSFAAWLLKFFPPRT